VKQRVLDDDPGHRIRGVRELVGEADVTRGVDARLRRPETLVDPDAVRERLREVRRDGYSWVNEEFDEGINSVAAPIADASGEVVAAVHLHGPSYRFPAAGSEGQLADLVVATAARISGSVRQAG